jgi:DNA invertase Pin-like site-specific DNA recombinase
MTKTPKIVSYIRVSTKKQGASGLGLEGQKAAVEAYCRQHGAVVVKEYVEVESGKRADRPELAKALGHARLAGATLVVAKLDRLARNVAFLSALMDSDVAFVACDNEHANRLTLHILAAVAEAEAKAISDRTKAALAAAKARGVALGSARQGHWAGREDRRERGRQAAVKAASASRSKAAAEAYGFLLPTIREQRERGDSLAKIAERLNGEGHTTRTGKAFSAATLHHLLAR